MARKFKILFARLENGQIIRATVLRGDVDGRGQTGSPGSGRASPYLRRDFRRQPVIWETSEFTTARSSEFLQTNWEAMQRDLLGGSNVDGRLRQL
jgi:hypothetical protein